jgi:NAD(P)-dependent dehydrogenase (short-subunit alcohol dehydrogenase family)
MAALRSLAERYEVFDVLALVAGIQGLKPIVEMDDSDWNDHIDVNLTGRRTAFEPSPRLC